MRVSIVGTGYVGLVSGACLAGKGHIVTCVDVDEEKVARINRAESPIFERDLDQLLRENVGRRLRATTALREAVLGSDLTLIAVGTPFDGTEIDLSQIARASEQIGEALAAKPDYHGVVVKSTVVPGTTDTLVRAALERGSGKRAGSDFGLGMNPEFLREGEAVQDFMQPDRIVLGGIDARSIALMDELYAAFPAVEKLRTSIRTAEMIKYAANSLLATLISFSNEIGNLCAALDGVDVVEVMAGVHLDKRFSPVLTDGSRIVPSFTTYLAAGCGFGGSCFPKDVKALIAHGRKAGVEMRVLDAVVAVNDVQPREVMRLLDKHFSTLTGVRVAVLGLAFKPGTSDVRESPSLPVIRALQEQGACIQAFDPVARDEARMLLGERNITYCTSLQQAVGGAEAVLVLTRWQEFANLPELVAESDPQPVIVDGRRMLDRSRLTRYEGVGLSVAAT